MPALAAILALVCQTVLAVPMAERMALERAHALAPAHADCAGMAGMAMGGAPSKSDRSKHDHQSCPFCATAALMGLGAPGPAAAAFAHRASLRVECPDALYLPARPSSAHHSRAPPLSLIA